jgi:hypothetical protein
LAAYRDAIARKQVQTGELRPLASLAMVDSPAAELGR